MKRLSKIPLIVGVLLLASTSWAQMQHAVIYAPSKTVEIETMSVEAAAEPKEGDAKAEATSTVVAPDIKCDLKYKWIVNTYKTAQVWYVYITPEELKCLLEAGDIKYWSGATAKEAWMAAYKSGLPDAVALFEQNAKVPVQVFDSEAGKQVEKMVTVTEAKALGVTVKESDFATLGDKMLPRKIFDGSK